MLCGSRCYRLRAKVFEEGSGYAGEKVDVGRACGWSLEACQGLCRVGQTVKATRQVRGDKLKVLRSRLDKIDDGNLFGVSRTPHRSSVARTSGIMCRVVPMFRCIVT
jgi:hypothetical protein